MYINYDMTSYALLSAAANRKFKNRLSRHWPTKERIDVNGDRFKTFNTFTFYTGGGGVRDNKGDLLIYKLLGLKLTKLQEGTYDGVSRAKFKLWGSLDSSKAVSDLSSANILDYIVVDSSNLKETTTVDFDVTVAKRSSEYASTEYYTGTSKEMLEAIIYDISSNNNFPAEILDSEHIENVPNFVYALLDGDSELFTRKFTVLGVGYSINSWFVSKLRIRFTFSMHSVLPDEVSNRYLNHINEVVPTDTKALCLSTLHLPTVDSTLFFVTQETYNDARGHEHKKPAQVHIKFDEWISLPPTRAREVIVAMLGTIVIEKSSIISVFTKYIGDILGYAIAVSSLTPVYGSYLSLMFTLIAVEYQKYLIDHELYRDAKIIGKSIQTGADIAAAIGLLNLISGGIGNLMKNLFGSVLSIANTTLIVGNQVFKYVAEKDLKEDLKSIANLQDAVDKQEQDKIDIARAGDIDLRELVRYESIMLDTNGQIESDINNSTSMYKYTHKYML